MDDLLLPLYIHGLASNVCREVAWGLVPEDLQTAIKHASEVEQLLQLPGSEMASGPCSPPAWRGGSCHAGGIRGGARVAGTRYQMAQLLPTFTLPTPALLLMAVGNDANRGGVGPVLLYPRGGLCRGDGWFGYLWEHLGFSTIF